MFLAIDIGNTNITIGIYNNNKIMETFRTSGVCSRSIDFEVENEIVKKVKFNGGCMGNTQGVAKLAIGRSVDDTYFMRINIVSRAGYADGI